MTRVLVIGEAMVELRPSGEDRYDSGVAGDVYNTAVYLKRLLGETATVDFLTALGDDAVSAGMTARFAAEGIDTASVRMIEGAAPGLYMIHTDDAGERSFTYWRSASAARRMLEGETVDSLAGKFADYDLVYFSGITLAILPEADAGLLTAAAARARDAGTPVAFDPNYRPRLWASPDAARTAYEKAYAASSILLPGMEDEAVLYGSETPEDVVTRLEAHPVTHLVIKAGKDGIFITERREHGLVQEHLPFTPAPEVVDTTAAGDSFAAGWLAGYLTGMTPLAAARQGHSVAAFVISQPGAITPRAAFDQFLEKEPKP